MERGMEMFTALVGIVLVLVGVGAMACYTMVFFFPSLHGLVVGGDRLPRARALLGVLVGFLVLGVGILFTGVALAHPEAELLTIFGFMLMVAGTGLSLYFAAAFLFPSLLGRNRSGAERPRRYALLGLLVGLAGSACGGFLWSAARVTYRLYQWQVPVVIIGLIGILTMACFAIAFLVPSFLDKLRIPRGSWPRGRALLGVLAGLVMCCGVAIMIQAVSVAEAERMDELNAAIQERIDGITGIENRSEPYIRPGSGEGAIHTLRVDYTLVNKTSDEAVQAVTVHSVVTNPEGTVIYEGHNPFDITAQGGPLEAGRSGSASWELQANSPDAPLEKEILKAGGKNIQVQINFSSVTTDKGTTALLTE